jgi:Holliday junction resolvasome RuvABC endonuclease subunit
LKGNASKGEVRRDALDLMIMSVGHPLFIAQDAADALLIAIAGQKRNDETWDRHVTREAS